MYLFLSSSDSTLTAPLNEPSEFMVQLPQLYNLQGKWEIGLLELYLPAQITSHRELTVMCDICAYSPILNTTQPVLRKVEVLQPKKRSRFIFNNPYYLPVITSELNQIKINITNDNLKKVSFAKDSSAWCVLHLKKV